jgi:hypothetical protein
LIGIFFDDPIETEFFSGRMAGGFGWAIINPLQSGSSGNDIGDDLGPEFTVLTVLHGVGCADLRREFNQDIAIGQDLTSIHLDTFSGVLIFDRVE